MEARLIAQAEKDDRRNKMWSDSFRGNIDQEELQKMLSEESK